MGKKKDMDFSNGQMVTNTADNLFKIELKGMEITHGRMKEHIKGHGGTI